MRVLLVIDAPFALHERTLIARLQVGLADEGHQVRLLVSEHALGRGSFGFFAEPIGFRERAAGWWRSVRLRKALSALRGRGSEPADVDIVHAFGGGAWPIASDLAAACDASLALEVWRTGLAERARAHRVHHKPAALLFAPDAPIERALLADAAPASAVRTARWGATIPTETPPLLKDARQRALVLVGSGRDLPATHAAFAAAAALAREWPDLMLFADADAARRANLYDAAKRAGVLDRLTNIDQLEDRRDLVLRADCILHPGSRGEQRSLLLDAMGAARPVIASADPAISWLIDARTCRLVPEPSEAAWLEPLRALLSNRAAAVALGDSARSYVREHHKWSAYTGAVSDAYEWSRSDGSIPFADRPTVLSR
jgi:hypothetical protein